MHSSQYLFLIYSIFFVGASLFALLTNVIFLRFAKTLGTKDQEGENLIRWAAEAKPALGGITFFIVFLISLACYSMFFEPEDVFKNKQLVGLLIATLIAFIMGLADDAYNTRPLLKFSAQIACGIVLIQTGSSIDIFEAQWLNDILTVVWVVGIMNSINMLDNMDAIATVVSIFILLTALLHIYVIGMSGSVDFMIIAGVLAALVGFLFFNWHPSRMFMGDTGSQFLGLFLAFIGIKYCWNAEGLHPGLLPSKQISIVLLVFMLPIIDTTTVVVNRIRRGQSPFVGGRDHTTHILSYQGLSDSQVAMSFAGASAVSAIATIFILKYVDKWTIWHAISVLAYFVIIISVMFYLSRINKAKYTD